MTPAAKNAKSWTCGRCGVKATWMPGAGTGRPSDWKGRGDELLCLSCRRAVAGEKGAEEAPSGTSQADRVQVRTAAVIEFELRRDPERRDAAIARTCRTSVPMVTKTRRRMLAGAARS